MLCSKKMILPSKFNVKLQKTFGKASLPKNFGGGARFRSGVCDFFSGEGGGYQHPMAMYVD
jgi:hypothetical protein